MRGYYLRKTAGAFCVLFVIVSLNFFLPRMIFADPAQPYFVGVPEDAVALREQIRQAHGFHEPLPVQYLRYLKRVVMLDLGQSHYYKDSVWSVMRNMASSKVTTSESAERPLLSSMWK